MINMDLINLSTIIQDLLLLLLIIIIIIDLDRFDKNRMSKKIIYLDLKCESIFKRKKI